MKKLFCVLCAITLLLAMFPLSARAAEDFSEYDYLGKPENWPYAPYYGRGFQYPIGGGLLFCADRGDHIEIYEARGLKGDVIIPETIQGKPVGTLFFENYPSVEGSHFFCFELCDELTSLTLPASLKELDVYPDNIIYSIFGGKNLKELIFLGDGPELLPSGCISCFGNLERVVLPKKVREMEGFFSGVDPYSVQEGSNLLQEIVLNPSNPSFAKDQQGIIYNKSLTKLITAAEGSAGRTELTLPHTVTEIAENGLSPNQELERIYGGENVTRMRKDELIGRKNLNPFEDTYGHWGEESAKWAFQNQVFSGTRPFRFSSEGKMTRGMMVSVLYRMEGSPDPGWGSPFPDVPASMYYAKPIKWASANGIAVGYSESRFAPEEQISREQMASMLYRYAQRKKEPMDISARGDLTTFTDHGEISDYAEEAMAWAVGEGFLSGKGDGGLDPQGTATRAEVASMLQRFWGKQTPIDE